ncbi:MAG: CmpA/NrtA family ABC transporter substrate-binding protein [Alcanivoracaceae bacterium]|nr:CmpA/NrtA family ABC transporter substrate-binding protein [Alcanivoracaceae bacterium]
MADQSTTATFAPNDGSLEKTRLTLGIIPLTDCASLVIAKERGLFEKYGLDVTLSREASWANIRDKVAFGELDGAHMLAGMPIATSIGIGAVQKPTITAFSMNLNGNAITVSNELYQRMVDADPDAMAKRPISAQALKKVVDQDKAAGKPPMTFAMVFPVSTHNYEMRYWMASAGIDPDRDIRLIVIPPPQMVANLESRNIDGYCVGEPWNAHAVSAGIGRTLITNYEIWNNSPEKVFAVNREWHDAHPNTHRALVQALIEASEWMDQPENREGVASAIAQPAYVDAPESVIQMSMTGTYQYGSDEPPQPMPDFNVFSRYAANYPWRSHAKWFMTQMYRWGQIDRGLDISKAAADIYRPDIYRDAMTALGRNVPSLDDKTEGTHASEWTLDDQGTAFHMGSDLFFDGHTFDPKEPVEYLTKIPMNHMSVDLETLTKLNRQKDA